MNDERGLIGLLRSADQHLSTVKMRPEADRWIREQLRFAAGRYSGRRRRVLMSLSLAGAVATAVLAVWMVLGPFGKQTPQGHMAATGQTTGETTLVVEPAIASEKMPCLTRESDGALELQGRCRLRLEHPGMEIETRQPARIRKESGGVRVMEGVAFFDVEPVPPGRPPARVWVSGGLMEVIGTRFGVTQMEDGGAVDLFEGRLRFVGPAGLARYIEAGRRFRWPSWIEEDLLPEERSEAGAGEPAVEEEEAEAGPVKEAEAVKDDESPESGPMDPPSRHPAARTKPGRARTSIPTQRATTGAGPRLGAPRPWPDESHESREQAPAPEHSREPQELDHAREAPEPAQEARSNAEKTKPSPDLDERALMRALQRAAYLRSSGRFDEAIGLLESYAHKARDSRTAEAISYEQGEIITEHLKDVDRACRHWNRHLDRFPRGRYRYEVRKARLDLECH